MAFADKSKESKYIYQFTKDNYDRLSLLLPKGDKDKIKARAAKQSKSLNQFIVDKINAPD